MLLLLPSKNASVCVGDVEYSVPNDWVGQHDITSDCGWWIGQISIVQVDGERYLEWLKTYSLRFDDE
jgi:hypothetical protein